MLPLSRLLSASGVALVLLTSPAFAAEITPEGAAAFKAQIQSMLDLRKNVQAAAGAELVTEGDIMVEPAGTYYKAVLPHIKTKYPGGVVYDFGKVAVNAVPGASEKEWKVSYTLPSPIRMMDGAGKLMWQLDLGPQRTSGVWNTDLGNFTQLNAVLGDLRYKIAPGVSAPAGTQPFDIKIAEAKILIDFKDIGNGHLSGPANVVVSGVANADPAAVQQFKIGNIRADYTVTDFDPAVMKDMATQMSSMGASGQDIQSAALTGTGALGVYDMVTKMIGSSADSFTSNFAVADFSYDGKNEKTGETAGVKLASFNFGFDMAGFRAGAVKTDLRLGYDGLSIVGLPAGMAEFVPGKTSLALSLDKLPVKELIDLGRQAIPSGTEQQPNAAPQMAGMQAATLVPQMLSEAGTSLTQKLEITAPSYSASGQGTITADAKSVAGFTAEQNFEIKGLDAVIAKLNEEIAKAQGKPEAQQFQQALATFTMLQMMGQQKPEDPTVRVYNIVQTADGKTTLNGADMSAMMGGMAGGAAPSPVPAP
jgi:hypothetical protein